MIAEENQGSVRRIGASYVTTPSIQHPGLRGWASPIRLVQSLRRFPRYPIHGIGVIFGACRDLFPAACAFTTVTSSSGLRGCFPVFLPKILSATRYMFMLSLRDCTLLR